METSLGMAETMEESSKARLGPRLSYCESPKAAKVGKSVAFTSLPIGTLPGSCYRRLLYTTPALMGSEEVAEVKVDRKILYLPWPRSSCV